MKNVLPILITALLAVGCSSIKAQQQVSGNALVSGHYIFLSQGQIWQGAQPSNVPAYIPTDLVDGGTMEADGAGNIVQCSGGSYGHITSPMACPTHWTVFMGQSDDGQTVNGRYGYAVSDQGDKATIACTETGKICTLTGYKVGWTWVARMERE